MKNKIFEKLLNCETKIEQKSSTNIKKETKLFSKKYLICQNIRWSKCQKTYLEILWFIHGNALKLEKQLFNGCPPHINWIKS